MFVQVLLILIHPNFRYPLIINANEVDSDSVVGKGHAASINVSDSRTRHVEHLPVTKPYFEAQFILFSAPNIELK